jgi:hypothetical protein
MNLGEDDERKLFLLVLEQQRHKVAASRQKVRKALAEAQIAELVLADARRQFGQRQTSWLRRALCSVGWHKWQKLPREAPVMVVCEACEQTHTVGGSK